MKVCMMTTCYPRFAEDVSGVFVSRLCQALVLSKIDVDVVAPGDAGRLFVEEMKGTQVYRFCYFYPERWQGLAYGLGGGIPANLSRRPWLLFQIPFFLFMFFIKTLRVSRGADVLHANWIYVGLIAWVVQRIRGIPFVVTLRGSDVKTSKKNYFLRSLSQFILKRAAMVTTVSQDQRRWVIEEGIPEDRVCCIRNGIDSFPEKQVPKNDPVCRLIFVGNLIPGKGVNYLIEALFRIAQKETCFSLTVIGAGSERASLAQKVKEYALQDVVHFIGSVPPDHIVDWMNQSDCLVLPSLWEGMPNVVLEAMASGLPVIATDLPGIREILVDGKSGFLFRSKDVSELSVKLLQIIQDPGLRVRLGKNGQDTISKMGLGWAETAKLYQECYQKVCLASQDALS